MLSAPTSPSLLGSLLTTSSSGPARSSCFCSAEVGCPQGASLSLLSRLRDTRHPILSSMLGAGVPAPVAAVNTGCRHLLESLRSALGACAHRRHRWS